MRKSRQSDLTGPGGKPKMRLDDYIRQSVENDPKIAAAVAQRRQRSGLIHEIRSLRKRRSLTQGDVAEDMDTTQSAVSDLETDATDPRLSTVQRYAQAVGMRISLTLEPVGDDGQPVFEVVPANPMSGIWVEPQGIPQRPTPGNLTTDTTITMRRQPADPDLALQV